MIHYYITRRAPHGNFNTQLPLTIPSERLRLMYVQAQKGLRTISATGRRPDSCMKSRKIAEDDFSISSIGKHRGVPLSR